MGYVLGRKNMTSRNLLTVLLPIYNGKDFLDRCLESLCQQTYKGFNIICVDDGSTDNTPKILKKWKARFNRDRMKIITNSVTQGVTKSLNLGLEKILSIYTARIDCDDWWEKDKLIKQLDFLESHPDYGVIGCNYVNLTKTSARKINLPHSDLEIKRRIIARNPFAHSCVIFRTDLVKRLGGYNNQIRYGQDYDLWLKCLPETRFYNLQEYLCFRNIGQGISYENQKEQMLQCMKTQIKYIQLYKLSPINYLYLIEPLMLVIKNSL